MLKNAYFLKKKTEKIDSATGNPPPNTRVVTPSYYYNFAEFVSSAKSVLLFLKKDKIATVDVLLLLLPHLSFLLMGGARIFLAPGRRVTLAMPLTVHIV